MDVRATDYTNGLKRRAFTNADVARMLETGVIGEDERFELLRGEIVPMPSEFDLHGRARWLLHSIFIEALGRSWFVANGLSLFLFDDTEAKPDFHVFDVNLKSHEARGGDVQIAIELAASSHHRDFKIKLPLYAEAGVREVWIIDLDDRKGHVYRRPAGSGYAEHLEYGIDQPMTPEAFPMVSIRVADLLR